MNMFFYQTIHIACNLERIIHFFCQGIWCSQVNKLSEKKTVCPYLRFPALRVLEEIGGHRVINWPD